MNRGGKTLPPSQFTLNMYIYIQQLESFSSTLETSMIKVFSNFCLNQDNLE